MNRQIKFRAWHKKLNKMLFPPNEIDSHTDTIDSKNTVITYQDLGLAKDIPYLLPVSNHMTWDGRWYEMGFLQDVEWMQFTGLLDKNGKEIYEGDKVEYNPNDSIKRIGVIEFSDYFNGWSIKDSECYPLSDFGYYNLDSPFLSFSYIRIIGNIYENPELLKNI